MNLDLMKAIRGYAGKAGRFDNEPSSSISTKLAGVSFENRQSVISLLDTDSEIRLVRDRSNPHDFHAVSVEACVCGKWLGIGFIPREKNKDISGFMDSGLKPTAKISKISGLDITGIVIDISFE